MGLVLAASLAIPAWPQSSTTSTYAIKGGKVFTLAGPAIENGTVIIRDGKIAAVGANIAIPQGAQIIDATGLEVYPGMFDPITQIGLNEVSAVNATVDVSELGDYNPELVAATAVNPASAHIPVTRANGITEVIAAPGTAGLDLQSGGLIAGQASAFNLAGWTMDEMQLNRSVAMVINWPSIQTTSFDFATFSVKEKPYADVKREYDKSINALGDWLDRARHYAQAKEKGSPALYERDLKLEALVPVVEGKLPVLVIADEARDIRNAVDFCSKQNLKMILGSGAEAWKVKEQLKDKKIPVVLAPTNRLPEQEDTPYDKPYTEPSELVAAGIPIAFFHFPGFGAAAENHF
jgi:imidazolonepropionase-like amidohydrolase